MNNIQSLKNKIKVVEKEIKQETNKHKKQRLNKYKQKLQIELRDYTFLKNGGKLI
jgi:hypothetical protein